MAVDEQAGAVGRSPDEAAGRPVSARLSGREPAEMILAKYGVLIAFVAMIVVFSLARLGSFPTWENAKSILTSAAPLFVIAGGLTVILVMQDFDLSFGAVIGLAAGAAVALMAKDGWSWPMALIAAPLLGIAAGAVNGFLVSYLGGPSFIITLAMGTVLTGVAFALTDQKTIFSGVSQGYTDIAQNSFLGLNNMIWIAAVIAV